MADYQHVAGKLLPKETPTLGKFAWDDPFLLSEQLSCSVYWYILVCTYTSTG